MAKEFTTNEKYLLAVIQNTQNAAPPDWEQIKIDTGMGSVGGARNKLTLLMKAYNESRSTTIDGPAVATTPKTPKTPRKRKQAADDEDPATPKSAKTPRTKKAKAKKEVVKEEAVEEDAGEEDVVDNNAEAGDEQD